MFNEIELAYWHAINMSSEELFVMSSSKIQKGLMQNALFAKTHCNCAEDAKVFRTFIEHNHGISLNLKPECAELTNQANWQLQYGNSSKDGTLQTDSKFGLQTMKSVFDALYYKRPKQNYKQIPFTFVNAPNYPRSTGVNETLVDYTSAVAHPTDFQLDYNELVDDLEEEHFKREVFTTTENMNKGYDSPKNDDIAKAEGMSMGTGHKRPAAKDISPGPTKRQRS
jgi:hypothetical protein